MEETSNGNSRNLPITGVHISREKEGFKICIHIVLFCFVFFSTVMFARALYKCRVVYYRIHICVMHSNKTGKKLHRPILRYGQLKLAKGEKSAVDFEIFVFYIHILIS